jgi:hypothetical protein
MLIILGMGGSAYHTYGVIVSSYYGLQKNSMVDSYTVNAPLSSVRTNVSFVVSFVYETLVN